MVELTQEFHFDAAHRLEGSGDENARLHGHSFRASIVLCGEPDPRRGWLCDLGEVKAVVEAISAELDHRLLNDLPGLDRPTLENLARFIYQRARAALPQVVRVFVSRPSLGQSCTYEPPA
jgi:6-pyruvoyltetrahydropterin/6-carboxytetrahydropterin synthase